MSAEHVEVTDEPLLLVLCALFGSPFIRLCLPMGILTAKVTDANAKSFLNKQSVTIFDQPKIGAVTTQLTDLQHVRPHCWLLSLYWQLEKQLEIYSRNNMPIITANIVLC